ncbi:MAG: glycosyltransferase, partial [Bacteroidaceae bacterium]|nr:glycosyltransferase [Bacteroidaceae bacterium]
MPQDSTDKTLRISVVMCTYNGERYLREQMDSILRQTYPVEEIVVQDDGSTDGTMQILEEYAQHNPLVKVFSNDSGQHGINANFFSAMRRAKGDYIAISDQDDIWELDKLRLQAEAIGDKILCSGFSVPFSADGFPVQVDWRRPCLHLLRNCYLSEMPGHTMLMRRD